MRKWLIKPDGGKVPPKNVFLLLSPHDTDKIPTEVKGNYKKASYYNIHDQVMRMIEESEGKGERLYFYYSGHGLTNRVAFSNEPCITCEEFTDKTPGLSFSIKSIYEFLETYEYRDQFFFIDACRNVPFEGEFVTGSWNLPEEAA